MSRSLSSLKFWSLALILVWIVQILFADQIHPYYYSILIYSGINIILAVSLNLVNGFTGQFSMGHAGFMAVGAYISAFLTFLVQLNNPSLLQNSFSSQLIFIGSLVAGGAAAGFAGYLVGLPSLRLKGDYLAIVTLGFGEIIRVILLNVNEVAGVDLGGARGMANIAFLTNFGWVYTFVVVTVFTITRIVNSNHGRALMAVREDEIAAESMGVHTTKAKVRAFVVGAIFSGLAGGLFAHFLRYLNPATFDFNRSFEAIIMVVLGGMGSLSGSVVAAVLLTVLREALRPLQEFTKVDFRMVFYSLILIVLMLTRPNGLFGTKEISHFLPKRLRKKWGIKDIPA